MAQELGAKPGPACYGFGRTALLHDADLLLGYLDKDYFAGEDAPAYRQATKHKDRLAEKLGMSVEDTAAACTTSSTQHARECARSR